MFPYIIFIVLILLFYQKKYPKGMLWVIVLFAVLRYDTGWDYASYVETISTPSLWNNAETSRHTIFWRLVFDFTHRIDCPHFAIAIPNALTYIIFYYALKVLNLSKKNILDALFVYVTWSTFFLGSFSIIRQQFAMSVGFLMFAYIQRRMFWKSILAYAFTILLHTSAVVLILLYPVYLIRFHLNFKWVCISASCVIAGLVSMKSLLMILSVIGLGEYEGYLTWSDNFGSKIVYINLLVAIYLGIAMSRQKRLNNIQKQCYYYPTIAFIGNAAIYILGLPNPLNRVFSYFSIFMTIILLQSTDIFKKRAYYHLAATCVLVIYFFIYLHISQGGGSFASSPYIPYKCILFN